MPKPKTYNIVCNKCGSLVTFDNSNIDIIYFYGEEAFVIDCDKCHHEIIINNNDVVHTI